MNFAAARAPAALRGSGFNAGRANPGERNFGGVEPQRSRGPIWFSRL